MVDLLMEALSESGLDEFLIPNEDTLLVQPPQNFESLNEPPTLIAQEPQTQSIENSIVQRQFNEHQQQQLMPKSQIITPRAHYRYSGLPATVSNSSGALISPRIAGEATTQQMSSRYTPQVVKYGSSQNPIIRRVVNPGATSQGGPKMVRLVQQQGIRVISPQTKFLGMQKIAQPSNYAPRLIHRVRPSVETGKPVENVYVNNEVRRELKKMPTEKNSFDLFCLFA